MAKYISAFLIFVISTACATTNEVPYKMNLSCIDQGLNIEVRSSTLAPETINTRLSLGRVSSTIHYSDLGLKIVNSNGKQFPFSTRHSVMPPDNSNLRKIYPNQFFGQVISFENIAHSYQLNSGEYSVQAVLRNLHPPLQQILPEDKWIISNSVSFTVEGDRYKCGYEEANP